MNIDLLLTILLVFMIVGAIIAVEMRDLLGSLVAAGLVGFGAALTFVMLGAPELALTQVVAEVICLAILIRATAARDDTVANRHRDSFATAAGLLTLGVVLVASMAVYVQKGEGRGLPEFGKPVAAAAADSTNAETEPVVHQENGVAAVLLGSRAFDTLGQMAVLLTAVVGATVILRNRDNKDNSDGRDEPAR